MSNDRGVFLAAFCVIINVFSGVLWLLSGGWLAGIAFLAGSFVWALVLKKTLKRNELLKQKVLRQMDDTSAKLLKVKQGL